MTLDIGLMPYLNSAVFYEEMPSGSANLVPMVPRAMALAVERGELAGGPLPVAEWFRMEDLLEPLGDYCVATKEASVSILFFTERHAGELDGARIAVTEQTATSVQLLRVLFNELWDIEPGAFVTRDDPHEALLLIGDEALSRRRGVPGLPHVYDLGEVWHAETGLPFVYARWVVRRDADRADVDVFEQTLGWSLDRGLEGVDEFADGYTAQTGLTREGVAAYLAGFSYRMGDPERAALSLFRRYYDSLPLWRPDEPADGDVTLQRGAGARPSPAGEES